jgi:large subunit ribosomal protein L24
MKNKIKLKKGDEVIVLAGKDKGKKGKIVRVIPDVRKVIVTDVNKYKKHQKPGNNEPGGIIEKDMPLHISNVAFFDSKENKGVRIGYDLNKDGKKIRINKKSGKEI